MSFIAIKVLHAACAGLTLTLFIWRGVRVLKERPIASRTWARRVPDVIDTLLLGSGVGLMFMIGQYPFSTAWLTAKLVAVLIYIGLGFVALRSATTGAVRRTAWLAALMVFTYIVAVAWAHSPLPLI